MSKEKESKSGWFLTTFPVIMSLVALVFSAWSFYNSELKVHHELQVSVTNGPDLDALSEKGPVNFTLAFLNRGNQAEVVLGAEVLLTLSEEFELGKGNEPRFGEHQVDKKYEQESFVLAAGGVKVWNLDSFQSLYRMEPDEYTFGVRIFYLDPRGRKESRTIRVGTIKLAEYGELKGASYGAPTIDLFD